MVPSKPKSDYLSPNRDNVKITNLSQIHMSVLLKFVQRSMYTVNPAPHRRVDSQQICNFHIVTVQPVVVCFLFWRYQQNCMSFLFLTHIFKIYKTTVAAYILNIFRWQIFHISMTHPKWQSFYHHNFTHKLAKC